MNIIVLYVTYFLIVTSFLSESCLSAATNSKCPKGTDCVFAASCQTVIRLIDQKKRDQVQNMYCEHEGKKAKVCCPSSETIIKYEADESETLQYNKRVENENDKITFPTDISITNLYELETTKTYTTNINPFPNRTICGVERGSDKIVGGTVADIDEFPWLGRIFYEVFGGQINGLCGATLITDRYLVTAGHCLKNRKPVGVRLGEWDLNNERACQDGDCSDKPVDIEIEKTYIYNVKDTLAADIGLIRLKEPVKFTDFISPICLPDTEYVQMQEYAYHAPYWATGWGTTEFGMPSTLKRKVSLKGVPSELCASIMKSLGSTVHDRVICAGGVEGKDTCLGDSGGPLMKRVDEDYQTNWYLFGITSFGLRLCGSEGIPSVYTKVSAYMDWIRSIVRN